jgi:hypothetical protein
MGRFSFTTLYNPTHVSLLDIYLSPFECRSAASLKNGVTIAKCRWHFYGNRFNWRGSSGSLSLQIGVALTIADRLCLFIIKGGPYFIS